MKTINPHTRFIINKFLFISVFITISNNFLLSQVSAEDSLFQQADYYFTIGYYDSAVNTLTKLIELNPTSATAYSLLGNTFNIQGKYKKAISMYSKCIELDSTLLPVYMNLGNAYIDAGKLDSAIIIHKYLIAKDSLHGENYVNLGDAYMKNQEIVKAQQCFEKAIQLNYYFTLARVNLATTYAVQQKYKEAIDELFLVRNLDDWYPLLQNNLHYVSTTAKIAFENWVDKEPNNSEAHYYNAFSLWYTDERGDAIDEIEMAIELNDKVEKYYLTKAIWLDNEEEYEDAVVECTKCLAINSDNWMCHNRIGLTYTFLKNQSEALTHYKRSVEIDPFVLQSQLKMGEAYIDNQQYSDAVESLTKAVDNMLASEVKNPVVYFDLALAYYYSADYDNAMLNVMTAKNMNFSEVNVKKDLENDINWLIGKIQQKISTSTTKVSPSSQNSAETYYNKGIGYAADGEFEKAKSEFEKSLQLDQFYMGSVSSLERINDVINLVIEKETALHLFKGVAYSNKSQDDEAIIEYSKAIELDSIYAKTYVDRGMCYYYKGETDQSIIDFTRSIEINPNYSQGYSARGWVYYSSAQYEKAINDFTKAIEFSPEIPLLYLDRGLANLENGKYNEAINDFTKAIEINPKYADAYNNRGYTYYFKLGDTERGCIDLKKACELGKCDNYNYAKRKGDCQ